MTEQAVTQAQEFPELMHRKELSNYLRQRWGIKHAPQTLAKLATMGGGPPFYKAGKTPIYPRSDADEWAKTRLGRLVNSTSELSGEAA